MSSSHHDSHDDDSDLIARFNELRGRVAEGFLDQDQADAELLEFMKQRAYDRNAGFRKELEARSRRFRVTIAAIAITAILLTALGRFLPLL